MRHALVAKDGTGGWARHRIPALIATPEGDLLAVHDGRHGIDDLPAPIDLVGERSRDGGRTWGESEVLRAGTGIDGYGDASLILDSLRRRLLVWCAASRYAGFFESDTGTDDADPYVLHTDLGISVDDGRTWTWQRKTAELRGQLHLDDNGGDPVSGLFPCSGSGNQIVRGPHRGRLLQSFLLLRGSEFFVVVARSDDAGASWQLSNELGPGANESTLCELADGTVLLHSRSVGTRLTSDSTDGGASFSALQPAPNLVDPGCNGSLLSWPDGAGVRVVSSHLNDPNLRRGLVLDLSVDGGRSWTQRAVITDAEAAYSTAVVTEAGVAVLWEAAGTRALVCSTLDETDFARLDETATDAPLGFRAVLRHVEPVPIEPSPHDVEVPAPDPDAWGAGVYKMAAPTPDGVQRIRSRAGISPDFVDTLRAGETLVLDLQLGPWADDDQLVVAGQPVTGDWRQSNGRTVAFGVRRVITTADLTVDPLVIAFAARRGGSSDSSRHLGVLNVSLRAGSFASTGEEAPGR